MTLRGLGDTSAIQAMIVAAADSYGVPENIALGIASHESGFNPNAINHNTNGTTDYGVMQLNTTTVQTMGVSNPMDPQQNINAGVQLLANLLSNTAATSTTRCGPTPPVPVTSDQAKPPTRSRRTSSRM
jgi:soluble lytic murein transglycosylase-like protein